MSRVLKFRAWNKLAQKMAVIDALDFLLDSYRAHAGVLSGSGHLADIELMQFTGLQDKNGREVYEDDIYRNLDNGFIGKFSYLNGPGGYTLYTRENNQDGSPHNMLPFMHLDTTNFEVIGNIYENPELVAKERE